MATAQKKANRLQPVVEQRQIRFDVEIQKLTEVQRRKSATVVAMRSKQREYLEGVQRLNDERGSSNRLMLEALEQGLDTVKSQWMGLYQAVIELDREEKIQTDIMSQAHRELEAIKTLQDKYRAEFAKEMNRREQKSLDELALRKFTGSI
jgi:flagellar export protein FliJ